jgi:hypothetical protein
MGYARKEGSWDARRAAWKCSSGLNRRITGRRYERDAETDTVIRTLATACKSRLECVPARRLDLVASGKQYPCQEPRKVLDGAVDLVPAEGGGKDLDRLGHDGVEHELGRDIGHGGAASPQPGGFYISVLSGIHVHRSGQLKRRGRADM